MLYYTDMKGVEQNILKQAIRFNQPIPDRIANAPELKLGLRLYLNAFFDLDCERSHALALTPISWSSIFQYAMAYDFDEEQTDCLLYFIRQMDNAHLAKLEKRSHKPSKTPKGKRK